jgi:hypothetical protein
MFVWFNFSVLAWLWKIKERVKMLWISIIIVAISAVIWIYTIWIYGSILSLWLWYIILFLLSFKSIYQDIKFWVERRFIIKNVIISIVLAWIIWYFKDRIFVFDDLMRIKNLINLIILWW